MVETPSRLSSQEKPTNPQLIQGGMGVGVSDWKLARAVAIAGRELNKPVLGVISGTGLPIVMVNRIQAGEGEDTLRILQELNPEIAGEIVSRYVGPENVRRLAPKPEVLVGNNQKIKRFMTDLAIASAYTEVRLAKEGHNEPIGINILEKVQLMHLPTLFGAMLAGVDYVLIGAGIPNQIPKLLEDFADGQPASYSLDVLGSREKLVMTLDPRSYLQEGQRLKKPKFYPIVSHDILAKWLTSKVEVDGIIIEGPIAGGHNAPPRGKETDEHGKPIYGPRDAPDLQKIAELGIPFYLAGGTAEQLERALELGAAGIQVGTAFALCNESGLREDLKRRLREGIVKRSLKVETDFRASPTGFPFQVVELEGTLSDSDVYGERERICSLGYLVQAVVAANGEIVFRCPAEPVTIFERKGGKIEDTEGRKCLCNGLVSNIFTRQEPGIITLGKDLRPVAALAGRSEEPDYSYSAEKVVHLVFSA